MISFPTVLSLGMFDDLVNAFIVVTGGGSGIGRAVCQALADCNSRVIIADLNLEKAEETRTLIKDPSRHVSIQLDVSSSDSVNQLVSYIENEIGQCPIGLVNSAGITPLDKGRQSGLDCSMESWNKVIDVNLKGTYLTNAAIIKLMLKYGLKSGSVVNIASVARSGTAPNVEYCASKAAVVGVTKTLAQELGQINIRVNAVAPGLLLTPLTDWLPENIFERVSIANPMRRVGHAEDVAGTCLYLLSQKASGYVTGQVINVSGGDVVQSVFQINDKYSD